MLMLEYHHSEFKPKKNRNSIIILMFLSFRMKWSLFLTTIFNNLEKVSNLVSQRSEITSLEL